MVKYGHTAFRAKRLSEDIKDPRRRPESLADKGDLDEFNIDSPTYHCSGTH